MYCKNCGNAMDPNAAVCVKCGCSKGVGTAYCPNCGQTTMPGAAVCTSCGYALNTAPAADAKSKLVAGLLGSCIAVGPIITGIWGLIEGIQILCGKITVDGKGNPLAE